VRTLALLMLVLTPGFAAATPTLWRGLEPGRHPVGYRSTLERDASRSTLERDASRSTLDDPREPGRAMRIGVWYPARAAGRTFAFDRYLTDLGRRLGDRPESEARRAGIEEFIAQAAGHGGQADSIRAALPRLLAAASAAVADAPAAAGRFPLVLFPDYRPPPTVAVLAEYLASHGFVVATIDMKGTFDADYDLGLTGMETQVQDLRFALGVARGLPFVDGARVAVMGVGISANAGLALQMRDPTVRAVVSLDGGLLSRFEDGITRRTPYWDLWAANVPLLAVHAPHPALDPAMLDAYRYADQVRVLFPRMSEFHFLAYGAIEGLIPSVIGRPPGDVNAGFAAACRMVRAFLASRVAGRDEALPPDGAGPDSLYVVSRRAALPAPPTLRELKRMLVAGGADSLTRRWRALRRLDPEPVSLPRFTQVLTWIANVWDGDRDGRVRRGVLDLRLEAFPRSARAHAAIAQAAHAAGERERAVERAREALALIDADPDPDFDPAARESVRARMRQILDQAPAAP